MYVVQGHGSEAGHVQPAFVVVSVGGIASRSAPHPAVREYKLQLQLCAAR